MMVAQAAVLRVGFRPVAAAGMALLGAGSLLLTQVSAGGSYFGDIFFGLLVFGAGIGPVFATATIAAFAGVAERESGVASGITNTAFQIGGALGVATSRRCLSRPRTTGRERRRESARRVTEVPVRCGLRHPAVIGVRWRCS